MRNPPGGPEPNPGYWPFPKWLAQATDSGNNALMYACQGGHEAVARLLLEHNADVAYARNDGYCALLCAVENAALVRLLLQHGADVDQSWANGSTALMVANQNGNVQLQSV